DYLGPIEYENDTLATIYLENSKLTFESGVKSDYHYFLKNHLMSTQVVFKDDANGVAEVVSQHQQYPFGLAMKGDFATNFKTKRLYNFKESISDFGLGWMDFGARYYTDGAVPVFIGVDPISDKFPALSTFNYASNKPVNSIDLHGLQSWEVNLSRRMGEVRQPSKRAEGDWLGEAIGYTLGALAAATGAAAVVGELGFGGTLSLLGNEAKDEALSQATGGASDVLDATKAGKKLLKSGLESLKGLKKLDDAGMASVKGGMKFESVSSAEASNFISTEPNAQGGRAVESIKEALQQGDLSVFSDAIYTVKMNGNEYILDGHNRVKAAVEVGYDKIPITRLSHDEANQTFKNKMEDIRQGSFE
ncbi:MAG: hypothetical protein AAF960_22465, partial [Bacteroidota bacterium]